jgi:hypothetical protein
MTRKLLIPALAALALASVAGCGVQNRGSVQLTQLCFPPTPNSDGSCSVSATCDQVLADGHLFVDLATSGGTLEYPIQVDNQREDNTDSASGRTNTNNATVERFDMKYEAPGFSLPSGSASQTASVPTSGSTVVVVSLIPASVGAALAAALPGGPTEVIVKVKGHGRYGDDTEFDTGEFAVPVAISKGLVGPYACADAEQTLVAVCPQQGQTATVLCE